MIQSAYIKEEFTMGDFDVQSSMSRTFDPSKLEVVESYCTQCKLNFITESCTCPICNKKLRIQCRKCYKSFKTKFTLKEHLLYRCNKKPNISCDSCSYKAPRKTDLVLHIRAKHSDIITSSKHKKSFKHGENYKPQAGMMYREIKHKNGKIPNICCDKCAYKTVRKIDLIRHIVSKHSDSITSSESQKCSKCNKTFNFRYKALLHERDCGEQKVYKCQKCDYIGGTMAGLYQHKYYSHSMLGKRVCNTCGKTFKNAITLRQHIRLLRCNYSRNSV